VLAKAVVTPDLSAVLGEATLVAGTATLAGRVKRQARRSLPEAAGLLRAHLLREPAVLLFGSEKHGLSNEHLSHCHWLLTIPTNPQCPSMNLGQAVALCCWELAREKPAPDRRQRRAPPASQLERIVDKLMGVLDASGYIPERTRGSQVMKVRRLIRRLELDGDDAQVVEGMLRQIGWKLESQDGQRG
jgi:tRNA/rRNA methyltransferase